MIDFSGAFGPPSFVRAPAAVMGVSMRAPAGPPPTSTTSGASSRKRRAKVSDFVTFQM